MSILITPDLNSSKQASLIAINRYIEELQKLQKKQNPNLSTSKNCI